MEPFTKRVIEIIKNIPEGKVMTYGQIARMAGSPRGARQVVRILHSMTQKYHLPWHRVINAKGEIGVKDGELKSMQRFHLESEGVKFIDGDIVDLTIYQHHPDIFSF